MSLTKEQILQADDLKTVKVSVPEWGGDVYVRTMTGAERDAFEQSIIDTKSKNKEANLTNIRAKLSAWTIVDEEGILLFSSKDITALGKKSAAGLDRVFAEAQKLNGLTAEDVEILVKNSETGQGEDSTSN